MATTFKTPALNRRVRVLILENHPSTIGGYRYQLGQNPAIDVVGDVRYGLELEPAIAKVPADALILDVHVPTSVDNSEDYPILHTVSNLLQRHPTLCIFVISMSAELPMIRLLMEAGVSAYILKDDDSAYQNLAKLIASAITDDNYQPYFSPPISALLKETRRSKSVLTRRQLEALSLAASHPGWKHPQLAKKLSISYGSVRMLFWCAFQRLEVDNLQAAIAKARELGLISSPHSDRR